MFGESAHLKSLLDTLHKVLTVRGETVRREDSVIGSEQSDRRSMMEERDMYSRSWNSEDNRRFEE